MFLFISLLWYRIQAHFESVQRIADSATLPHVMHFLDIHLAENLDLTPLTERLIQGKDQANALTMAEKLELWDRLKILSTDQMLSPFYNALPFLGYLFNYFLLFSIALAMMFYRFYKNGIISLGNDYAEPLYQGSSQHLRETSLY